MSDNKRISVKIGADISQLEQATATAASKLSGLSNKLKSASSAMLPVTGAVTALGAAFVATGNDWDAATKTIQTATGATGAQLESLKQSAQNVFGNVPADAETVAAAIGTLNTHLGATGPVLESLTTQLLEVSRALGEDAAANTDAFGKALNSFGISASEAAPQLDFLFTVTQQYGVSLNSLLGDLNNFGPVLQNAGFSMAEAAEFMGQLNQSGINVSRVMPALNKALRDAADQGVTDLKSHLIDATEAIANATDRSAALDQAVKIFGAEGAARMTAALQAGNVSLRDLAAGFDSAKGAIEANAEDTRTLSDNWRMFKNQLEAALAPLGTQLVAALQNVLESARPVLDWIRDAIKWFTDLPAPIQATAAGIAALATAIGPLALALQGVMGTISTLQTAIAGIGTAASMATPLLIAFGAAIAAWAIYKAVTHLRSLNDELDRLYDLQQRGIRATDQQAEEIRMLEAILDKHRITVDSTGKSVEEYLQALRDAAKGLGEFSDVTSQYGIKVKLATDETAKAKTTSEQYRHGLDDAAESTRRVSEETRTLGDNLQRIQQQQGAAEQFIQSWVNSMTAAAADSTEQFYQQMAEMQAAVEAAEQPVYDLGVAMDQAINEQIKAPLEQLPPAVEKVDDAVKRNTDTWNVWSRQVSTIVSDLGKNITNHIFNLFKGSDQKKQLEQQKQQLQESLEQRRKQWEDYRQDIAEKLQQLESDYRRTISDEEQKLQESLESRRRKYEQDRAELEQQLQERLAGYESYKAEVADRIEELRQRNAESLQQELSDLQDALDKKKEALDEYVADTQKRLDRIREDYADSEADKKRETERRIDDATRRYKREEEDIRRRIDRLRRANKTANDDEIRDLERKLARKKQDYDIYVRRQKEDLADWVEDHKRRLARQEQDLQESLDKRQADYAEYVADAKDKAEQIRADHQQQLTRQVADLQASLDQRKQKLDQFKQAAKQKLDEMQLDWETYKNDAVAQFEDIKQKAAEKLDAQKAELTAKLNEQKSEWETFRNDVNAKIDQIDKDEQGLSKWNRIAHEFGGMLADMGKALARAGIETWFDGLIKKLTGKDGVLSAVKSVGKAIGNVFFGGGGGAASVATDVLESTHGGGLNSALGGIAGGPLNAVFAGVSAATGIIGLFQGAHRETSLNAIEHNTRYSMMYLGERADGGIMTASLKTLEWLQYNVGNTDAIKNTLWTIRDLLQNNLPNLSGVGGSDTGYIVANTDDMKSSLWAIRDQVVSHLPDTAADIGNGFDKLTDIAGQSNLVMRHLQEISGNTRGLLSRRQDINIDVHFDGLVAAVAKQVKTEIVREYKLQTP